jgi:UDP-N-acetylmuramoylalanine-D-glutamate ligase
MDSKTFFQNCPATIIAIAGYGQRTTAAMLEQIFNTYFATTDLKDKVLTVAAAANPIHHVLRDVDTLGDISNIDIVLYLISNEQLTDLAVNLPYLIIGQTTDPATQVAAIRATKLGAKKTFYLGRDLNSYALANRTMSSVKYAFPDDLPFPLPNLQVVGSWQHECAAAAALVAKDFQFAPNLIQQALANFAELPHHLDFIREINGVKYYDDGVSVTPELASISIRAFTQPIIISTVEFPPHLVKRQILIPTPGQSLAAKREQPLGVGAPLIDYADSLSDAASLASIFAVAGDVVLFVPAVAGLPIEEFVMEVNQL